MVNVAMSYKFLRHYQRQSIVINFIMEICINISSVNQLHKKNESTKLEELVKRIKT